MQKQVEVDLTTQEPEAHEGLAMVELRGGRLKLAEQGFLELTGYQIHEVQGMSIRTLFPTAEDALDPVEEGLKGWKGELELNVSDGSVMPVYVSIVPARDDEMADVAFMMRINRVAY